MSDAQFSFEHLTPDMLINALESVGIRPESGLLPLNSYENRVYQFQDEERRRFVTKFYRPQRWSNAQILEEHQFAFDLEQADIPVAAPIMLDGNSLFEHEGYRFAVFPSVGGRSFEVDNWDQLEMVGRFLGRIHKLGASKPFTERPTIGLDEYLFQPRKTLENSSFIPHHLENAFFSDLDRLIDVLSRRWQENWPSIRLHGDCHPSNILWRDGPMFVDLDDARNGPAIQDIWMLLNGDRNDQLAQLDTVAEAYSEFYDFPHQQLQLIEPLRGLRMVHYMAWLAKRWQDPAFPRAFPWFAEAKYWESQVLAFKEQLAALEEPALTLTPQW
ncbi:serine/threonine protein kinase [Enterovibrio sp. ZSDZ35]|uniref:Stress response kinase A n=1 Tax=Enterovibrio qingdaonensis TaxID=2899818 RepID=A0ABT5QUM9_9GAMM|nr:serine/threonine protein kinase [Enterovibrio sp. ZSDZ35]MDD1784006.1 serine/threonine protein kinase [Enterovibrio sp. ZSDZ35]